MMDDEENDEELQLKREEQQEEWNLNLGTDEWSEEDKQLLKDLDRNMVPGGATTRRSFPEDTTGRLGLGRLLM
jgi:hypothetical protein